MKYDLVMLVFWLIISIVPTEHVWSVGTNQNLALLQKRLNRIHGSNSPTLSNFQDLHAIKKKITYLYEADQLVRQELMHDLSPQAIEFIHKLDKKHTDTLKEILDVHGWLIISKFGKETDYQAWTLVQHADHDPKFQAAIAFLLGQLVSLGETDAKNFAYLYDRVAIKFQHLGLKQRYGTQADIKDNQVILYPFEGSLNDLNQRRQDIGLEPVEDYIKQLTSLYTTKNDANS